MTTPIVVGVDDSTRTWQEVGASIDAARATILRKMNWSVTIEGAPGIVFAIARANVLGNQDDWTGIAKWHDSDGGEPDIPALTNKAIVRLLSKIAADYEPKPHPGKLASIIFHDGSQGVVDAG